MPVPNSETNACFETAARGNRLAGRGFDFRSKVVGIVKLRKVSE